MTAANRLGIEMLTLLGMAPVEHIALAADLGCAAISTGLGRLPLERFGYPDMADFHREWSLLDDSQLRRDVKRVIADTGVGIALGEGVRVAPGVEAQSHAAALDIHAELGTARINAICTEPDMARAIDQYGLLSDMVLARGMDFLIEFAPPHAINSWQLALHVADTLGHERCGMMVDSMHLFRSGATAADLAGLPIRYAQMADAPRMAPEGMPYLEEAMFARRVPGEGELPLAEWIAALPADCPIGLEVPVIAAFVDGMTPREHAARVVAAARALGA